MNTFHLDVMLSSNLMRNLSFRDEDGRDKILKNPIDSTISCGNQTDNFHKLMNKAALSRK